MRLLAHPYILPLIDFGISIEMDHRPFLVTPFCKQGNLRSLLAARSFLPQDDSMRFLRDVGAALDYAHAAGVIHGDIKPENILITDDQHASLADFGAAKYRLRVRRSKQQGSDRLPEIVFTELYSSPEQMQGRIQSVRADVYSFTMVAYELLTGRSPVRETDSIYDRMLAKIEGRLLSPADANPTLPPGVIDELLRGLSNDPMVRPSSAGVVVVEHLDGFRSRPGRHGRHTTDTK